jgi:exopolyphosphatase/guanosine-5'-triphosphate,3'-diphosphate pyrophosphatase
MRIAAVDLGTNSFLCLVAEVSGSGSETSLAVLEDHSRVVRLGEKVHEKKEFIPAALERARVCLTEFSQIIKKHKVDKVIGTATSAARDAKNGDALLKIGKDLGIPIHIIGGKKEAELSFAGAMTGFKNLLDKNIIVIDVGGGSTELIHKSPGKELKAQSFDVGVVRLTEMFLKHDPILPTEYAELRKYAVQVLSQYGKPKADIVIGVAGTPTTLACMTQKIVFDDKKIDGFTLTKKEINDWAGKLGALTVEERKKQTGLEPKRADVIVAGCALLDVSLEVCGHDKMLVSTRGLRYGVVLHHELF